ncbi:uncharacterized protein LOC122376399 [Amphibalanus amphitrite]|uniref:uncharacterized protein LOC122376399 n=1 Tax=Amphibalanus amphitrite TaxID=1232801 RepID=UPI001C91D280|nr:uncharacterized protein LOC122376399 [Amphibalanus amphitrite]
MARMSALVICALACVAVCQGSLQKRDTEYAQELGSPEYSNNYYQQQYRPRPVKKASYSPFGWVQNLFRRSSYDSYDSGSSGYSAPSYGPSYHAPAKGGPGIADIILPIILICAGLGLAALAAAAFGSALTSSGRGLDTDEWEVDHSVWMNQLQKDFEDSWSTE